MRTYNLLLGILFLFAINSSAQTNDERAAIINTYNQNTITELRAEILELNQQREERINQYLIENPHLNRKQTYSDGTSIMIIDVIDGNPMYISTDNVNAAKATRADFLQPGGGLGLNLEGLNITAGVWEINHALNTHQEFQDFSTFPPTQRLTRPDFDASTSSVDDHSTHVSGTIGASGVDSNAEGMAPKSTIVCYDADADNAEALNEATTNALLISNHSYGVPIYIPGTTTLNVSTWLMGCYNSGARLWDDIAYNAPYYLMLTSAGNGGQSTYTGGLSPNFDKLTTNKNSKNNLVVGNASNPAIDASGNLVSLTINNSSSQGPTDDGRIKPDIVGDGTDLFSSGGSGINAYTTLTGTSMSCPNVAGTLVLLQEYYNQLNSQFMRSATIKALACHTADDDGSLTGPDPIYGWGLMNGKRAAETIADDNGGTALITEEVLADGGTYSITFTASGTEPLSATLCWTDPPGADQSGILNSSVPALVNDLDLRITDASTTHMPWKLQLTNIAGLAIKGDNIVDNVEKVEIPSPTSGSFTLTVSHKGTITNSTQPFSLVLTGANVVLSRNENAISDFKAWPNPTKDFLNFSFRTINSQDVAVSLVDIQGRKVYENKITSNSSMISESIDTKTLSKGVYFLNIKNGNFTQNKKVIIY